MSKLATVTPVSSATTIDAMLALSKTDWGVRRAPMTAQTDHGQIDSGGFDVLFRPDTGTALAAVSKRYGVNDHRRHLQALQPLVDSNRILPESVSVWDNGAVLAYQFRCPDLDVTVQTRDGFRDVVSPLLTLAFCYGFRLADSAFFAEFRWFCKNQNGQVASLNFDGRVRHRGDVVNKYADVLGDRIGQLGGELAGRYQAMRRLTEKPLKGRALYEYFGESIGLTKEETDVAWVTPAEDIKGKASAMPEILDCYALEAPSGEGTVWQAYNAVTRYETHVHGHNEATRQRRMLLGDGSKVANRAWEAAVRVAA